MTDADETKIDVTGHPSLAGLAGVRGLQPTATETWHDPEPDTDDPFISAIEDIDYVVDGEPQQWWREMSAPDPAGDFPGVPRVGEESDEWWDLVSRYGEPEMTGPKASWPLGEGVRWLSSR